MKWVVLRPLQAAPQRIRSLRQLVDETKVPLESLLPVLERFQDRGWVSMDKSDSVDYRVQLTDAGVDALR